MCKFMDEVDLSTSKKGYEAKKRSIMTFFRPNKGTEFYRVRLLAFTKPELNDRSKFYIERYYHDVWTENEKGVKLPSDNVTCLMTDFVDFDGSKKDKCPMCNHAFEAYLAWKSSGFKDKISMNKFNQMKKKYQFIFPFYFVNDPNEFEYKGKVYNNNGKMSCFMFTEKKVDRTKENFPPALNNPNYILCSHDFLTFLSAEQAKAKANGYRLFNANNAVDLCIRVDEIEVVHNEGKPNEYKHKQKVITKMQFTTKPYTLSDLTDKSTNSFEFDETYYFSNTISEINDFYKKYYGKVSANIPEENIDMMSTSAIPVVESIQKDKIETPVINTTVDVVNEIEDDPIENTSMDDTSDPCAMPFDDDLPSEPFPKKPEMPDANDDNAMNKLMEELGI